MPHICIDEILVAFALTRLFVHWLRAHRISKLSRKEAP